MSNIRHAFENGKAFIPFITCGDPDLETTGNIIREAVKNGANGYIVKPVNENILVPNLLVAHAKSQEIQGLHKEIRKAEEDLAARRIIEHAKGYLMDTEHMTEDSAYVYIRTLSRENRMSMKEVAEMILEAKDRQ